MHRLLLVRHAPPLVEPGTPPQSWRLGAKAKARVLDLAKEVRSYTPSRVVTSDERKARETGTVLAEALGLPCETFPGLHEHERGLSDFFASDDAFRQAVHTFFEQPNRLIFGHETAAQAQKRFTEALATLSVGYPGETLAVVSHGTVISLAVALWAGCDAYAFWQRLPMPALIVVEFPEGKNERTTIRVWPNRDKEDR